jgi:hypothetical protein
MTALVDRPKPNKSGWCMPAGTVVEQHDTDGERLIVWRHGQSWS